MRVANDKGHPRMLRKVGTEERKDSVGVHPPQTWLIHDKAGFGANPVPSTVQVTSPLLGKHSSIEGPSVW